MAKAERIPPEPHEDMIRLTLTMDEASLARALTDQVTADGASAAQNIFSALLNADTPRTFDVENVIEVKRV